MKKLAILFVAGALALGACSKKNEATTPTGGDDMGNPAGDPAGGDAYGADTYGAPVEGENPCGDAANPCG